MGSVARNVQVEVAHQPPVLRTVNLSDLRSARPLNIMLDTYEFPEWANYIVVQPSGAVEAYKSHPEWDDEIGWTPAEFDSIAIFEKIGQVASPQGNPVEVSAKLARQMIVRVSKSGQH